MKSMTPPQPRTYRKRKRAEAEEDTRRRITEAAVELHGTVGPANSTVTDVAALAGVSRTTVYSHFPTEVDLFRACSGHWASENPFPDPGSWTEEDPSERLGAALKELYRWYGAKRGMLGNVLRDVPVVPALAEVMAGLWDGYMEAVTATLAHGWPTRSTDTDEFRAMVRLGVDFGTWRLLADSGLDDDTAAEVMARMVTGAVRLYSRPGTATPRP
jgi:AcrR family transcriptional regulator